MEHNKGDIDYFLVIQINAKPTISLNYPLWMLIFISLDSNRIASNTNMFTILLC